MEKPAIYLKFNRTTLNSYSCLNYWLEVARLTNYDLFFLCDLEIEKFPRSLLPILLCTEPQMRRLLEGKLAKKWVNAGAAHLTTFSHSRSNGFASFWNVDADDTLFLMPPEKLIMGMHKVEEYSESNRVDSFSLDMYQTFQFHWSFGVTFTRNTVDYLNLIKLIDKYEVAATYPKVNEGNPFVRKEDGLLYCLSGFNGNIDWFFTFMRDRNLISAKSFYFNDSCFAHVGVFGYDELGQLVNGVYQWRDGKLWGRPVVAGCVGFDCN